MNSIYLNEKRLPFPREAEGAQISHSQYGEVVTKRTDVGLPFTSQIIGMSEIYKSFHEDRLEDKSGARNRGNSSSSSVNEIVATVSMRVQCFSLPAASTNVSE